MDYAALFNGKRVALQFSGGKESLVLLHMMQPYWDSLTVYHCNSGDSFPENDELVAAVKSIVPHFVEVMGRRPQVEQQLGWPSDIVPAESTLMGKLAGSDALRLVDRYTCCYESKMRPLHERMHADGIQVILRGQRNDDSVRSPVRSGDVVDGFQIFYPLADFSRDQVFIYLNEHGIPLPRFYQEGMTTGSDCLHCTAWLEDGQNKYLKKHHPQAATIVFQRLSEITKAVDESYKRLLKAQEE